MSLLGIRFFNDRHIEVNAGLAVNFFVIIRQMLLKVLIWTIVVAAILQPAIKPVS